MKTFSIARSSRDLPAALDAVLTETRARERLGKNVFIKPNFTYPHFKPGVTTTREVIEAVVHWLKQQGCTRICLGEGDGGYNTFSMDQTFANYRLEELNQRYGLEIVNVGSWPSTTWHFDTGRGVFDVNLPRPVFEEFDSFISIPVPKVHVMTTISNAVKNQWGLIQDSMRLRFHLVFNEVVTRIVDELPFKLAIVDGTYGLTRSGPMIDGTAIELGWISACDDLWLNDALICDLMKVDRNSVEHLVHAQARGLIPAEGEYATSAGFADFVDDRFFLKRNVWNRVAKLSWKSPLLNHLFYFSGLSGLLHKIMYSVRSRPDELTMRGIDW